MTVKAEMVKRIMKINGFKTCYESNHEHEKNSAYQRLRYNFQFQHIASGIKVECWLRHNLEGHNNSPSNTHRFHINLGTFSKNFDFWGKDNGPSPKELNDYMKKLDKALNGFIELR